MYFVLHYMWHIYNMLFFSPFLPLSVSFFSPACKRKEEDRGRERNQVPKKQRLVFTDLQRRTLVAIFRENRRPSKEMQLTISQQLGLELSTVSNFFMNSRRRCPERWDAEDHSLVAHGHVHTPHGNSSSSNNNNNGASPIQPGTSSAVSFSKAWRLQDGCRENGGFLTAKTLRHCRATERCGFRPLNWSICSEYRGLCADGSDLLGVIFWPDS